MRAVAVLLVVAFHAGLPLPGGFVGVDVFFVISGFVITGLLAREWADRGRVRFGAFYRRRIQRLTPALGLTLAVVLALSILLQSPFGAQQTTAMTAVGAVFGVANFVIPILSGGYFDAPAATNPLLNTWSLSVEEQFYVAFPFVLAAGFVLAQRNGRWRLSPILAVGMLTITSFALMMVANSGRAFAGSLLFGFFGPVPRAWEFGAGALLTLTLRSIPLWGVNLRALVGWCGGAGIVASALILSDSSPYPSPATLLPVLSTVAVIYAGTNGDQILTRFLSSRPMTSIGDISYSWYLWHWPIIVLALTVYPEALGVALIGALLSLVPAVLSYRFVEQPVRLMTLRPRSGVTLVLAATVLPVTTLAAVTLVGARAGWGITWMAESGQPQSAALARGCHNEVFDPDRCTWVTPHAKGAVLLVGDSQAYALSDGLIAAAADLGLSTTVTSQNACPFADVSRIEWRPRYAPEKTYCAPWNRVVLDYALRTKPAAVVIANRSPLYVNSESDYAEMLDGSGNAAASDEAAADYWAEALDVPIGQLRAEGIPVVIVAEPPEGDPADLGGRQSILIRNPSIPIRALREEAEAVRLPSFRSESRLADGRAGVQVVDPFEELCDDVACPGGRDGKPLYTDSTHLSRYGALVMRPLLDEALGKAVNAA